MDNIKIKNREVVTMIQVDTREKARAIKKIVAHFQKNNIQHIYSKLYVGDYVSLKDSMLCIDRKQNLTEVYSNLINDHARFKAELIRAQNAGIKLIILVEHGGTIKSIDDVEKWDNPRRFLYKKSISEMLISKNIIEKRGTLDCEDLHLLCKQNKIKVLKPPIKSEQLTAAMRTMSEKYGVIWNFCDKKDTGKIIAEILKE